MNWKLKLALILRSSEKGFAMPVAIGMGLMMMLIGATMVVRSQGDRVTATSQVKTAEATGASETGVAQILSFLSHKNNGVLARFNLPDWRETTINTAIPPGTLTCTTTGDSGAGGIPLSTLVDGSGQGRWVSVNNGRDRYRILNYIYTPNAGVPANRAPGTGRLLVQSQSNTAQDSDNQSSSVLEVNIPVTNSPPPPIPGLWIQDVPQTMSSNQVDGNILVYRCPPDLPSGVSASNVTAGHTVTPTADFPFPDTPPLPSTNLITVGGGSAMFDRNVQGNAAIYPAPGDPQQPDGSYAYLIQGSLSKNGGGRINIQAGAKVAFYVQGNINMGGGPNINLSGDPGQFQVYGNTYTNVANGPSTMNNPPSGSTTKYGCAAGSTLGTNCPTMQVYINGSGTIVGLFHAPDASGAIAGGGGQPGLVGAVWIRQWNAQSGNQGPHVRQAGNYGSFLATSTRPRPETAGSTQSWRRCNATSTTTCQP